MFPNAAVARTLADHVAILGVPPDRIRCRPAPGTATFEDWKAAYESGINCELANATLVDRPMGMFESMIACVLIEFFRVAAKPGRLGITAGEQGFIRLFGDVVRAPDVAFFSRKNLPEGQRPPDAYPRLTPDIIVEVLSGSNSAVEMTHKRQEYFRSGASLVWMVDPVARTVAVYESENDYQVLSGDDILTAPKFLPSLRLTVAQLFEEAEAYD